MAEENVDKEAVKALQAKKFNQMLTVGCAMLDMVVASNTLKIPQKFGVKLNDGILGVVGTLSALIGLRGCY